MAERRSHTVTTSRRRDWMVCAAVLIVCGCGSDGSTAATVATSVPPPSSSVAPTTAPPTTASPTTAPPTTVSPTTAAPTTVVSTTLLCPALTATDVQSDGFPGRLSGLVGADVRVGADACHERVVFELQGSGQFPGWWVRYQDPPLLDDPRGEPVDVAGSNFIVVTIESWMTNMEGEGYTGPTRIAPNNVAHVKELVMLGDFESVTTWAIGVDQQRPFAVSVLDSPPRLVIDLATT